MRRVPHSRKRRATRQRPRRAQARSDPRLRGRPPCPRWQGRRVSKTRECRTRASAPPRSRRKPARHTHRRHWAGGRARTPRTGSTGRRESPRGRPGWRRCAWQEHQHDANPFITWSGHGLNIRWKRWQECGVLCRFCRSRVRRHRFKDGCLNERTQHGRPSTHFPPHCHAR